MNYDDFINLMDHERNKMQSFLDSYSFQSETEQKIQRDCERILKALNDVTNEIEKIKSYF
jgi:cell division protein ZapA (FtsZ GTPase activity inhibitor)